MHREFNDDDLSVTSGRFKNRNPKIYKKAEKNYLDAMKAFNGYWGREYPEMDDYKDLRYDYIEK